MDGDVPVMETSLLPLVRWGQLEALKKEKETQLARTADVCTFLHECGSTQVQLQDLLLQLETLDLGQSKDSHRTLQLAQQKMLTLERRVHYLQRAAMKYSLGLAWGQGPGRQGKTEQGCGNEEWDRKWWTGRMCCLKDGDAGRERVQGNAHGERASHTGLLPLGQAGEMGMRGHHPFPWGIRAWTPGLWGRALTRRWTPSPRAEELGPPESRSLQEQVEPLWRLLEQGQQQVARQAKAWAEARARQSFLRESQQLLLLAEGIWAQLHSEEKVVNVASAQQLLMEHTDLLAEIQLQQERSGGEGRQGDLRGTGHRKARGRKQGVTQGSRPN